ncbi:MAG: pyrroline-5-carboxylate reductase [Candidatus Omnitrophica bacterium]|nr:pyrroline-5-carboxylate reductase [Candidatus Omnitrophota bacterium]
MNKIGVIGCGNMGSVIAGKLSQQINEYEVWVFDKDKERSNSLKTNTAKNALDLVDKSETIILAIKPQDLDHLLKEIRKQAGGKLVISIAAGISTRHIENILGDVRVIRVMPNIAAKIAESVSCLCKGKFATSDDLLFTQEIFYYLGITRQIDESMMNAATAISASGPGYIFNFIENSGLDPQNMKTKLPPGELKKQEASKGGTTEAGLEVIRKGGSWEEAAQAALKRAEALARRD